MKSTYICGDFNRECIKNGFSAISLIISRNPLRIPQVYQKCEHLYYSRASFFSFKKYPISKTVAYL